jgi:RND family efflux transporter MFP subunit
MSMSGRKARWGGAIVGGVLVIAAVASIFLIDWRRDQSGPEPLVRPLKTIVVAEPGPEVRTHPARIRARQEVTLAFEVAGVVRELHVRRGERVEQAQVLAQLDLRDFESRKAAADARFRQASVEFVVITDARERGAVSEMEFSRASAAVELAQAELDLATKALEDATLLAPFDGIVADIFIDRYANIATRTPVMRLQDSGVVWMEVNVPESRVAFARAYERRASFEARFDFLPDRTFPATLAEFTTEADPVTQTFRAIFEIEPPQDAVILPGMTATIIERLDRTAPTAEAVPLMIPIDAVHFDDEGAAKVWLVEPAVGGISVVRARAITIGEITSSSVRVTSGLDPGAVIAGAGVGQLREGQRVRPFTGEAPVGHP